MKNGQKVVLVFLGGWGGIERGPRMPNSISQLLFSLTILCNINIVVKT
jgi:hypothetical protein